MAPLNYIKINGYGLKANNIHATLMSHDNWYLTKKNIWSQLHFMGYELNYEDTDYMGGWVMTLHITRGEALSYYKGKYF